MPTTLRSAVPVNAFWCRIPSRPNFGDALTPWLIRRITGRHPTFVRPDDPRHKYLVTGSIIAYADRSTTVWGAGVMSRDDPVSTQATLLAVRGPLTRARALECGASCPEVYGDPALLLPRVHRPCTAPTGRVGLVPHFSDRPRLRASVTDSDELHVIDIQRGVESVIDDVVSCDAVASSSLHGLIAAHAYGVPALWVTFGDLLSGDGSKFADHFLSLGLERPRPVRLAYDRIDVRRLRDLAVPPPVIDTEPLALSCPFGDLR